MSDPKTGASESEYERPSYEPLSDDDAIRAIQLRFNQGPDPKCAFCKEEYPDIVGRTTLNVDNESRDYVVVECGYCWRTVLYSVDRIERTH